MEFLKIVTRGNLGETRSTARAFPPGAACPPHVARRKTTTRKIKRARTRCGAYNRTGSSLIFHRDGAIGRIVVLPRPSETKGDGRRELGLLRQRAGKKGIERKRRRPTERGIESGQKPERKKDSGGKERGGEGRKGRLRPGVPAGGRAKDGRERRRASERERVREGGGRERRRGKTGAEGKGRRARALPRVRIPLSSPRSRERHAPSGATCRNFIIAAARARDTHAHEFTRSLVTLVTQAGKLKQRHTV